MESSARHYEKCGNENCRMAGIQFKLANNTNAPLVMKHLTTQNQPKPPTTSQNHPQPLKTPQNHLQPNGFKFHTSGRKHFSSFYLILQLLENNLRNWLRYF